MAPAPLGNRVFVKAVDRRAKAVTKNYLDKAKGQELWWDGNIILESHQISFYSKLDMSHC